MKEMLAFLDEQDGLIREYDETLVRKLIERATVLEDKTLTVEFKSGVTTKVSL